MTSGPSQAAGIVLSGLIAVAAAIGVGRFVYTPILPFMEASLGLTKAQGGVIASSNYLGYLLGAFAAAKPALPGGRRSWLLATLAVSAATTGIMGFSSSMTAFMGLRFIGGFVSAFVLIFASAVVMDRLVAARRSGLSTLHFAGVGCGITVSAALVSGLAAVGYDWQTFWLASGAISLLALGATASLLRSDAQTTPPAAKGQDSRIDRRLAALIVSYGLVGFGYIITATFIATLVRTSTEIRHIEPVIWLVVGLSAAPSVPLWIWIGQRWGNDRSLALACLVEAVGVAMSVLSTSALAVIVSATLLGGTFVGITAIGLVHARHLSTGDPRRSIAFMTAAFGAGQIIGPTFAGYAYGLSDSFLVPSLVAAAALLLAAGLAVNTRIQHRPTA